MKKVLLAFLSLSMFLLGVFVLDISSDRRSVLGDTTMNTTAPTTTLAAPTNLDVDLIDSNVVRIKWSAPPNMTSSVYYKLYRNAVVIQTLTSTSFDDKTVAKGETYKYSVIAADSSGAVSPMSEMKSITIPVVTVEAAPENDPKGEDMTAPAPPTSLRLTIKSESKILLQWNASSDESSPITYKLYRDGAVIASTKELSFEDTSVKVGKRYSYSVRAVDSAGNVSESSNALSVEIYDAANEMDAKIQNKSVGNVVYTIDAATTTTQDAKPPSAPTDLQVKVISPTVARLTWKASSDNVGVANYVVFRNGVHIGGTDKATYYDDITVEPGKQYEYFVKARDIAKNESPKSAPRGIIMPYEKAEATSASEKPLVLTAGTNPDPVKMTLDIDGDGVSDAEEIRLGTNLEVADTDGDGFTDGAEIFGGFDPLKYSPGDKSDKIVFESPKDAPEKKSAREDKRYVVEKVERAVSEKTGIPVTKFSGRGLPNSYLTLYIYSNPIVVVVRTDETGNWQYELDHDLEDGEHEVYVAVTDNLGRITAQSTPLPFVKTAQAITIRPETLPAQAVKENQSPLDRLFFQFVGIGVTIAILFVFIAIVIIRNRSHSTIDG